MNAPRFRPTVALLIAASLAGCQPADRAETEGPAEPAADAAADAAHVVEVTTSDYAFLAPPRIPSGWVTFRMTNEGEEAHFFVLWKLPEGRTFDEWAAEVVEPFNQLSQQYWSGAMERAQMLQELGGTLPEWFHEVDGMGGVGLTAPGRTAQTTVHLEPGDYVVECYVRAPEPEARFHNVLGMLRPLIVTEEATGASAPEADVRITLSNYTIAVEDELGPGEQTVRVEVTEEPEGLLGHDVHLARLPEGMSVDEVAPWMDWVDALQSPAPVEFLGGAEQVPAGHTTYFTVTLEPGRYAWISEGYAAQGMVKEFTVEAPSES